MSAAHNGSGAAELTFRTQAANTSLVMSELTGQELTYVSRLGGSTARLVGVQGDTFPAVENQVVPWNSMVCKAMAEGRGPNVAPRIEDVPVYRDIVAGWGSGMAVSYVGMPLRGPSGEVLGSVCGVGTSELTEDFATIAHCTEVMAASLSTILNLQLRSSAEARDHDFDEVERFTEGVTRLPDRVGWGWLLRREEQRAERDVTNATVAVIQLDAIRGTRKLKAASRLLQDAVEDENAVLARIDGREFGVLLTESNEAQVVAMAERIQEEMDEFGAIARVGWSTRDEAGSLENAWRAADLSLLNRRRRVKTA